MKLPPGQRTLVVTANGPTTISTVVPPAQSPLRLGTITLEWSDQHGCYYSPSGPSSLEVSPDGTFVGATGSPPNVHAFGGTWS